MNDWISDVLQLVCSHQVIIPSNVLAHGISSNTPKE